MLYFSRWKAIGDPADGVDRLPVRGAEFLSARRRCKSWPKWAQRHIVLGLDLQGGSHILLEVDANAVRKEKVETLRDDVRRVLREARSATPASCDPRRLTVEFRIREGAICQPR